MGSFNVSCGISGMTIGYGDPAGLLLLSDSYKQQIESYGKFYSYPDEIYSPYVPPVFGLYDDYGELSEIESSETTRYLEEKFGISIDTILRCINNYGRPIHSFFGPIYNNFSNSIPRERLSDIELLEKLGFSHLNDGKMIYMGWIVKIIGYRWELTAPSGVVKKQIESRLGGVEKILEKFSFETNMVPGYERKDWETILGLKRLRGMFIHQTVLYKMIEQKDDYLLKSEDDIEKFYNIVDTHGSIENIPLNDPGYPALSVLINSVKELCSESHNIVESDYDLRNDLTLLSYLHDIMFSVNRLFVPAPSGDQFGNNRATLTLSHIVSQLSEENLDYR